MGVGSKINKLKKKKTVKVLTPNLQFEHLGRCLELEASGEDVDSSLPLCKKIEHISACPSLLTGFVYHKDPMRKQI